MSSNHTSSQQGSSNSHGYWHIEKDRNNIAWVHFDTPKASANLLSQTAIKQLVDIIKEFEEDPPQAVVILSQKKDSFIFGADIKEFTALDNKEQALKFMHNGHALMNRLENLPARQ